MLGAALSACSGSSASTGGKGYVAGDGSIVTFAPGEREPAPDLTGKSLAGKPMSLANTEGHPVVINVWASWCGPCRVEAPDLVKAAHQLKNTQFFAINTRDGKAKAQAFVRSHDIPYPSLFDPDGQAVLKFYDTVNVKSLPFTLVLDAKGRVAAVVNGKTTTITLVDLVHHVTREA